MTRVGIGIITSGQRTLRPEYTKYAASGSLVVIHVDKDHRGCSYNRNEVLKSLYDAGCEHFFLMDDDVWPLRDGWQHLIIEEAQKCGVDFIGTPWPNAVPTGVKASSVAIKSGTTAQFVYMTRKCVDTVGYFDERYGSYGPEDADYVWRAVRHGMNSKDLYYPLVLPMIMHIEDFCSCFTNSTFTEDQKAESLADGELLLQGKVSAGTDNFIPYPRSA